MAASKKATSAKKTASTKSSKASIPTSYADVLRKACGGRALGPTLEALLELSPRSDYLTVDADALTAERRKGILDLYGIVVVGRAEEGYFGPLVHHLADPIDASPIGYADRQGLEPEIVAKDLAEFLTLWAFVPRFFRLQEQSESDLEDAHDTFFEEIEDEDDDLIGSVLALPAVRAIDSGEHARDILDDCPELSFKPQKKEAVPDADERANRLFREHVGRAKLLVGIDSVKRDGEEVTVLISVNAPRDLAPRIVKHPSVDRPLRAFRSELREELPDDEVKLAFVARPASADPKEALQSLTTALRHAGASDLMTAN